MRDMVVLHLKGDASVVMLIKLKKLVRVVKNNITIYQNWNSLILKGKFKNIFLEVIFIIRLVIIKINLIVY